MEKFKKFIFVRPPPPHLQQEYNKIFTTPALYFLYQLVTTFSDRDHDLIFKRYLAKYQYKLEKKLPKFVETQERKDRSWRVAPVPARLINRRLALGNVSPSNTSHFCNALNADVQGIEVDFDVGHCPNWENQILGLSNVYDAVHRKLNKAKNLSNMPILMFRPRPWNMYDSNILIHDKKVPGPLLDFALLMFHNHAKLVSANAGPFFYLSKLESAYEAKLWNDIFVWTQQELGIPHGTIKACVLIENILSAFEMDEILYELKDHCLGLNCGEWDYVSSIIRKFGDDSKFVLPDRYKYLSMQQYFLKKYMDLIVKTCHARGTHATGGMAALLIENKSCNSDIIEKVVQAKKLEIESGVDGFLVYDLKLVSHMNELWNQQCGKAPNQLNLKIVGEEITEDDLLKMPSGGVMLDGLKYNIEVCIIFIYHWFKGSSYFFHKGVLENSSTADISRWQVWQWIRHKVVLEDTKEKVSANLVKKLSKEWAKNSETELIEAYKLFIKIVSSSDFPEFITTYLFDNAVFQQKDRENKFT